MNAKDKEIMLLIADILDVDVQEISHETAIGDFDSWDSLAQVSILTSLEEEYDCSFDEEEMMDIETVADMIRLIKAKS